MKVPLKPFVFSNFATYIEKHKIFTEKLDHLYMFLYLCVWKTLIKYITVLFIVDLNSFWGYSCKSTMHFYVGSMKLHLKFV